MQMHLSTRLMLLAAIASTLAKALSISEGITEARDFFDISRRQVSPITASQGSGSGGNSASACPAVWTQIAAVLQDAYLNKTTGECTALARQNIRMGFHDCGTWNLTDGDTGGCDGSIILAGELARAENDGMQESGVFLSSVVAQFDNAVTTADMIQFGAAVAIVTCPLGPQIQVFVGRKDNFTASTPGLLPLPSQSAPFLSDLFAAKGFSGQELAALLGAHTVSQQFFVNTSFAGQPQDDTPGIWDVDFYGNTASAVAGTPVPEIFTFQSDFVLSTFEEVGEGFRGFVGNQGKWEGMFSQTMTKLSLNGVPGGSDSLIDCTSALPAAVTKFTPARKRSVVANPHSPRSYYH